MTTDNRDDRVLFMAEVYGHTKGMQGNDILLCYRRFYRTRQVATTWVRSFQGSDNPDLGGGHARLTVIGPNEAAGVFEAGKVDTVVLGSWVLTWLPSMNQVSVGGFVANPQL